MNGLRVLENNKVKFDSSKDHLLVDIDSGHFKIVTINAAPLTVIVPFVPVTQTVLQIPHGLKYTPLVDAYFFAAGAVPNNPDAYFQLVDNYYHNFYSYIALGSPVTSDLQIKVDNYSINVIHTHNNTVAGADTTFPVKMKYTIYSNEGYAQL